MPINLNSLPPQLTIIERVINGHRRKLRVSQDEYLAILFHDNGFTLSQQRAYLKAEYGVKYVDELTVNQKSEVITTLKIMKGVKS